MVGKGPVWGAFGSCGPRRPTRGPRGLRNFCLFPSCLCQRRLLTVMRCCGSSLAPTGRLPHVPSTCAEACARHLTVSREIPCQDLWQIWVPADFKQTPRFNGPSWKPGHQRFRRWLIEGQRKDRLRVVVTAGDKRHPMCVLHARTDHDMASRHPKE